MRDYLGNELLLIQLDPNGDDNPDEFVPAYVYRDDLENGRFVGEWLEFRRFYIPDHALVQDFLELRLGAQDHDRCFIYDDVVVIGLEETPLISRLTEPGFYFDRLPTYGRIV